MRRAIGIALALSMLVPFLALADQAQDKKAILDTFSSLADKNPAVLSGAVFAIGDAYMRDNKQDEAIAIYEKAQSILGENEDFLSRLGNLYNMKMQYDKAAKIYEKLLASRPDNSWYAQMLATSLNATGKKDDAAGIWKKMINEK
ncbi:MAG: tetratricopeptide repeat protein, partial [Candidatus Omnitrophica bacterium]|nr:tetratricopeptide repeat protein [Candidatus Omnitrophota bacterium]